MWLASTMGGIYCRPPGASRWEHVDGNATELAVGTRDCVVAVASNGRVFRFNGMSWSDLGCPWQVAHAAVSDSGRIFVATTDGRVLSFVPQQPYWQPSTSDIVPL